jgi:hypothetical protein
MALKIPNDCKLFQMIINYASILHSVALQNYPHFLGIFGFEKIPSGNPGLQVLQQ